MKSLSFLKLSVITLSFLISILSAVLTVKFLYGVGVAIDEGYLMAALGLILDLSKCLLPIIIIYLFRKHKYTLCIFSLLLSIALSVISFTASFSTLQESFNSKLTATTNHKIIDDQIMQIDDQINSLRTLAIQQQKIRRITASVKTINETTILVTKRNNLLDKKETMKSSNKFLDQYSFIIALSCSLALEFLCWLLTMVSYVMTNAIDNEMFNENALKRTQTHLQKECVSNIESTLDMTESALFALKDNNNKDAHNRTDSRINVNSTVANKIKMEIIKGVVVPSQRGIQSEYKISRVDANNIILDLFTAGLLEPFRNGYKLK